MKNSIAKGSSIGIGELTTFSGNIQYMYDGKLYSSYEKFPGRVNDYDDISYLVEGYHYSVNEETNEIEREGISLVAESGINLIVRPTDKKGEPILLTPSDYIAKDKNGNIKRDSISNIALNSKIVTDDDIKNLLHIKRSDIFSTFNLTSSFIKRNDSDEAESLKDEYYNTYITETYYNIISNKYSSKFASINELWKRFLNERLENSYTDPLTEYELLNLNALHQIMGIKYTFKDPLQEYQDGMLHHNKNQEIEFINRVSYLEESKYLSSFTQTEINFNFRDCESNDCFKNFAYLITYYDFEETFSKFDEFMEKVEFLLNENLLDVNKLIRNNHKKLGIIIEGDINDFDIRERLNSGVGSKTYKFNEYSESVEPSSEDLSKFLNIDLESKGEGIAYIANSGRPEECADIKRSISIKNKIHKLQSPVSRNQDEIDEMKYYLILFQEQQGISQEWMARGLNPMKDQLLEHSVNTWKLYHIPAPLI
ncbi:hypothetical protein LY90DRAFT_518622 [Neocallimastix californiae]|uniref:Uncharacterized protein n=1 Tax=Neocallimastix californiae TaxID=1754190 RepID=A0A1Y1ZKT4_9FUNG|nr:hypothetical protein LY90DRAFT_518622 [Neocallimastix californiae]|eukprot:ORY10836.1 hypothetical protein LY90DRAFT_518622 [Neocallimastix californiae]